MSDAANVHSLERIQEYLEESKLYRGRLLREIENLQVELRKLSKWIENDAIRYWEAELQLARRRLSEAQDALTRCMSYVRAEERKPCTEEKKRVQKTQHRRGLCEEKLRLSIAASKAWQRESAKNMGKVQRVHELAESDLTVMIHHLESRIETLAQYASLRSGAVSTPAKKADAEAKTEPAESANQPSSDEAAE